jgi:signal transduction histidine kinase
VTERVETELSGGRAPERKPSGKPPEPLDDEQEQVEEALERRRGKLAFVAHEIRNPLSTALWSAELLVRMPGAERSGPRGDKLAGMCLRSLARVRLLVEDHFLCERLEISGIPIRAEPIPIAEVVQAAIGRRPADAGPCSAEVASALSAWADLTLLGRSLDALLFFAGRGGAPVKVVAGKTGKYVSIRVDGAPPVDGALREPDRNTPSDTTGRGLALPTARRIVEALGGSLSAEPTGFLMTLPLDEAGEDVSPDTRRSPSGD